MKSRTARRAAFASCLFVLAGAIVDPGIAGNSIDLRNGTVAGGGHIVSAGQFVLIGTVAEPVQGTTTQGAFRMTAGFPATIGQDTTGDGGRIFADGFED